MMLSATILPSLLLAIAIAFGSSYTVPSPPCTRQAFLSTCASTFASAAVLHEIAGVPAAANAFDGSGSTAYAGRTPASKAELQRSYRKRIAADVKDFNILGAAIDRGETDGDSWVGFFIEFQRREPDDNGRTYAALADFTGTKEVSGCGQLLASSYGKPGKPSDNLPSVKKYNAMAKAFEPIRSAGKKGDAAKAKVAWVKAGDLISEYLKEVGMQDVLSVPIYN